MNASNIIATQQIPLPNKIELLTSSTSPPAHAQVESCRVLSLQIIVEMLCYISRTIILISGSDSLTSSLAGKLIQTLRLVGDVSNESGQSHQEDERRLSGLLCVLESLLVEGSPVGKPVNGTIVVKG